MENTEIEKSYKIEYEVTMHPKGIDRELLEDRGTGGCDSIVIFSLIYPKEGGCSMHPLGRNGETGDYDPEEMFKAWAMYASIGKADENLPEWQKKICKDVHDAVGQVLLGGESANE